MDNTELKKKEESNMNTEATNKSTVPQSFPAPAIPGASASNQVQLPAQASVPTVPASVQIRTTTAKTSPYICTSGGQYFTNGGFDQDMLRYRSFVGRKTGYANLDQLNDFYPGLYSLGAGSAGGKTTYCLQLADQQAVLGNHVMYFAMEQTRFELYSKSLSRGFFLKHQADASANNGHSNCPLYSGIDIRKGRADTNELKDIINDYVRTIQDRVHIFEGSFKGTVEDICDEIRVFVNATGVRPIVIIDYLQIISPSVRNGRALETKASVDHIVQTLKEFQIKYDLTVILISSLNRSSYMVPVDYESFKESGGIEYTADVVWGLQLALLNDPGFYHHYDPATGKRGKEKNLKEKRAMMRYAKVSNPRRMELLCLKNRGGEGTYSVSFDYVAAYDTFIPTY